MTLRVTVKKDHTHETGSGAEAPPWVRPILERLTASQEVLQALVERLAPLGLEQCRHALELSVEELSQARALLVAGGPPPPVD